LNIQYFEESVEEEVSQEPPTKKSKLVTLPQIMEERMSNSKEEEELFTEKEVSSFDLNAALYLEEESEDEYSDEEEDEEEEEEEESLLEVKRQLCEFRSSFVYFIDKSSVESSIKAVTKEEKDNIAKVDGEEDFCSDYFEENYGSGGYFPSYEEDRR
jgi:hypothetical protein